MKALPLSTITSLDMLFDMKKFCKSVPATVSEVLSFMAAMSINYMNSPIIHINFVYTHFTGILPVYQAFMNMIPKGYAESSMCSGAAEE